MADFTGDGGDNTFTGGPGADTASGGGGNDTLRGAGGDDTLDGDDGNDTLIGGSGTDAMSGGAGDDWFYVDNALDTVNEGPGGGDVDRVLASASYALGAGVEVERLTTSNNAGTAAIDLTGNELANLIYGNAGANGLGGGDGNDILVGGAGIDALSGGPGDDWLYVDHALDTVDERSGEGTDRVLASVSYALGADDSIERLTTSNNAGTAPLALTGNELANIIYGNAGDNVLNGRGGADALVGFAGDDWYYVDNALDTVTEAAGEGTDRVLAGVSYALGADDHVERLTTASNAGTAAIALTGNAFANLIYGNAGNNVLDGRSGADALVGFAGDDWFYVDNAADTVTERADEGTADRVLASVSYRLGANTHVELLTTSNDAATAAINLTGNALANELRGNAGGNVLDGRGDADTMTGLGGNDWYYVDDAGDTVIEGAAGGASDRILASVSYTLAGGVHVEHMTTSFNAGTAAIDLTGNELANYIAGNAGANILAGGMGDDSLAGLEGDDVLDGGDGVDTMNGGLGDDVLDGGASQDNLAGGFGADTLYGGADNDTLSDGYDPGNPSVANNLYGEDGDDSLSFNGFDGTSAYNGLTLLDGGAGNDTLNAQMTNGTLSGGAGNDTLYGLSGTLALNGGDGNDTLYLGSASYQNDDGVQTATGGLGADLFHLYPASNGAEVDRITDFNLAEGDRLLLEGVRVTNGRAYGGWWPYFPGGRALVFRGAMDPALFVQGAALPGSDLGTDWMQFWTVQTGGNTYLVGDSDCDLVFDDQDFVVRFDGLLTFTTSSFVTGTFLRIAGTAGGDTLNGSDLADDIIFGVGGNDTINGLAGRDSLSGGEGEDEIFGGVGNDYLYGGEGNDEIFGEAGNDTIYGDDGNDTLNGGAGGDTMIGGTGDDTYYLDSYLDSIVETAGEGAHDRVYMSAYVNPRGNIIELSGDIEEIYWYNPLSTSGCALSGTDIANYMQGTAGPDHLFGKGGADTMVGLGGDDQYWVEEAGDVVIETADGGVRDEIFTLVSFTVPDNVEAISGINSDQSITLTGNEQANSLGGSLHADMLDGRGGSDGLGGSIGDDVYAFTTALGADNVDTIYDFNADDDTIWLDSAIFTGLSPGVLPAGAFATGSAATQADDRIVYNSATGALLFDADGLGGLAGIQFATLSTGLALTSADFIVV